MSERPQWQYVSVMDNGLFKVEIPHKLSVFDCEQMEAQFAIMMRQARRRAVETNRPQETVA